MEQLVAQAAVLDGEPAHRLLLCLEPLTKGLLVD
jgi:hypothetical protein